ncbi:hypothetical protein LHYA1_G009150 [Lachnellula hyalina]|uniref:Uncharacterized protein n=1 Tax=Lachnellula hyalina TaxID=1316788 RepID=A0A8H8QT54_9HELO|nr:uncharacterized protein LHYA1_G009150 [Lachnellula hyalina]TVY22081.1 hypothetical protein LHYA1_G009150 [Lachnellula hyalina]
MAERYTSAILCAAHNAIPQIRLERPLSKRFPANQISAILAPTIYTSRPLKQRKRITRTSSWRKRILNQFSKP